MTGGEHGQQIGPPATAGAAALMVVEALGMRGMVPRGQEDGEQCLRMLSWYRVSGHMITYVVYRTSNEFAL